MPAVEICSDRSAAGMIASAQAHIVVRQEHHPQQVARDRIVVDHLGDVVDQLDDQLRLRVARRRLAGEDLHARHPVPRRLVADREVERDRLQDVEQLALVFVDALDLHVEQRIGIEADAHAVADQPRRARPCWRAWRPRCAPAARRRCAMSASRAIRDRIVEHLARRRRREQHLRQCRIGLQQPAAEGDAVGLVDDAVGIERVQIAEHGLAHQLGMQRRDAVDPVRADEGEMAHAHACGRHARRSARSAARRSGTRGSLCFAASMCSALIR